MFPLAAQASAAKVLKEVAAAQVCMTEALEHPMVPQEEQHKKPGQERIE